MTHLTYKTIGGSRCGRKHVENQDRIILRTFPQADDGAAIHLIGVVDGISGSPFGASVARWLVEKHLAVDDVFHSADGDLGGQLETIYRISMQRFSKSLKTSHRCCEVERL